MKTAVKCSWERLKAQDILFSEQLCRNVSKLSPSAIDIFPPEVLQKFCEWDDAPGECNFESVALRRLFAEVMSALGHTIEALHDLKQLVPLIKQLGARYRVSKKHWGILFEALKRTLREGLGEEFTPEVEMAWTVVYSFMAGIMITGLHGTHSAHLAGGGGHNGGWAGGCRQHHVDGDSGSEASSQASSRSSASRAVGAGVPQARLLATCEAEKAAGTAGAHLRAPTPPLRPPVVHHPSGKLAGSMIYCPRMTRA